MQNALYGKDASLRDQIVGHFMRTRFIFAFMLLGTSVATAQEPVGCDKTKFPIDRERAALTAPKLATLVSGGEVPASTATTIKLRPFADAGLSKPPEREQKPDRFAGTLNFVSPGGAYSVAVSDYAWIDVLQNGTTSSRRTTTA